jgi:putative FmdB family regulatory protein
VPIYDYRCDECGHRFSAVQSFSDAPIDKCPNCGKRPRKLLVPPAIVFKGSGWYKTDSRTAPKDTDSAASSDKGDKGDKKDAKADAKPEAKKDSGPKSESSS